ncbi:LuxR C-terminal-related transcriptional regulator [Zymobacter sp. IVIA_12111.31 C1]|uniref:LuxR family transcriptional regulator n=1 Tax=Zymobacter sp. IVIA_12111.31 C1 TaxID=3394854 RepID=UPI0039C0740B
MNSQWQIDLYDGLNNAVDMQDVLDVALKTVKPLGFDYAGWRTQLPIPISKHKTLALNTSEDEVLEKVSDGGYDESQGVQHCSRSIEPFYWLGNRSDSVFNKTPELWEEYYSLGRFGGWAQSLIEKKSMFSLFWVDTSSEILQEDIDNVYFKMQWISISVLSKMNQFNIKPNIILSEREKEVLRWSGDGKTADEIGLILSLSHSTVNFHLRNAMHKLDAKNKTSAVVKAIYLNLLH